MNQNKLSLLGLCAKAGKVVSGGFMTERSIADGSAYFVIIAEDASDNTKKKFINKCQFYEVPYVVFGLKTEIGRLIGKEDRTSVAITDSGFGNQFIKRFGLSKDLEV